MPKFNKVILMGNLTRDHELRYTPNGQAVSDLRLAVNRRLNSPDGERRDEVTFVEVTAWGRQAEVINEYFSKGQPIFIEGRLKLDEWTAQDGQKRSKLRVILERFEFLASRSDGQGRRTPSPERPSAAPRPAARPAPAAAQEPDYAPDEPPPPIEDDVPF